VGARKVNVVVDAVSLISLGVEPMVIRQLACFSSPLIYFTFTRAKQRTHIRSITLERISQWWGQTVVRSDCADYCHYRLLSLTAAMKFLG